MYVIATQITLQNGRRKLTNRKIEFSLILNSLDSKFLHMYGYNLIVERIIFFYQYFLRKTH